MISVSVHDACVVLVLGVDRVDGTPLVTVPDELLFGVVLLGPTKINNFQYAVFLNIETMTYQLQIHSMDE